MKAVITDTEVMGNENNLYFQFGGCQAVARVSKYEISQVEMKLNLYLCYPRFISLIKKLR